MPLVWREEMSVGDPMIDGDHKTLISIINTAETVINEGRGRRDLQKVLDRLCTYTREHFAREESLQRRIRYPFHEAHVLEHQKLVDKLNQIRSGSGSGAYDYEEALVRLVNLLEDWLITHVLSHDMRMKPYVKQANAPPLARSA